MCSAVLGELESRHADLALRLWAPGSSHMRTLVGLCAQALLGVRSGAAGAHSRGLCRRPAPCLPSCLRSSAACLPSCCAPLLPASLLACAPLLPCPPSCLRSSDAQPACLLCAPLICSCRRLPRATRSRSDPAAAASAAAVAAAAALHATPCRRESLRRPLWHRPWPTHPSGLRFWRRRGMAGARPRCVASGLRATASRQSCASHSRRRRRTVPTRHLRGPLEWMWRCCSGACASPRARRTTRRGASR